MDDGLGGRSWVTGSLLSAATIRNCSYMEDEYRLPRLTTVCLSVLYFHPMTWQGAVSALAADSLIPTERDCYFQAAGSLSCPLSSACQRSSKPASLFG